MWKEPGHHFSVCFSHQCVMLFTGVCEHPFQEDIQVQDEASKLEWISRLPWSAAPLGNYRVAPQLSYFQPNFNFHPLDLLVSVTHQNLLLVQGMIYHDHIASKLFFQQAKRTELFRPASHFRPWLTRLQLRYPPTHIQEENKSHHDICRVINFVLCQ